MAAAVSLSHVWPIIYGRLFLAMSDERCCASHCRPRTVNEQPEFRYGVIIAMEQACTKCEGCSCFHESCVANR